MTEGIAGSLAEWFSAGKGLVDLFKGARDALPKGKERDEVDRALKEAEKLLARSDAKLAHDLGYELCKCTFPPSPMLYRHSEKAHVCQNEGCGNKTRVLSAEDFQQTYSGDYDPLGWMGR